MINPIEEFKEQKRQYIKDMSNDDEFQKLSHDWFKESTRHHYSYVFSWM